MNSISETLLAISNCLSFVFFFFFANYKYTQGEKDFMFL